MSKQVIIGFLGATLLLVTFEYIFLTEIYAAKRPFMMMAGIAGIVLSAFIFIYFFIKFRRTADDN